jgi:hypothetical protein
MLTLVIAYKCFPFTIQSEGKITSQKVKCYEKFHKEVRENGYLRWGISGTLWKSWYLDPKYPWLIFPCLTFSFSVVLCSYYCYSKLSQTWRLITTWLCYLTVLKVRSWNQFHWDKIKMSVELAPFGVSEDTPFHCLF